MSCLSILSPNDENHTKPSKSANSKGKGLPKRPKLALDHIEVGNTILSYRKAYVNPVNKAIGAVTCTQNGKIFALCYENTFQVIEAETLYILFEHTFEDDQVRCMTFAPDDKLWLGTFGGVIYILNHTTLEQVVQTNYTILTIAIEPSMTTFCFSNMDMKIFFYDLKTKELINNMKGKAVSIDAIAYDHHGRLVTTSMEHIVHIWDKEGKLVKALIPIKEASFTNGRSYLLPESCGTLVADKKEDRKKHGETYVWDLDTERLVHMFKSYESTVLVCKDHKILYDNLGEICVYDITKKTLDKIDFDKGDITTMYGCQDYCLTGSIDGYFSINYYRTICENINDARKRSQFLDIYWKFN